MTEGFDGAKVAILTAGRVVALARDDRPGIPWPGMWDLPGGAREGTETPLACALRELREETGLILAPGRLRHGARHVRAGRATWFFGAVWPGLEARDLRLGAEGRALVLMPAATFAAHPRAIPHLAARLRAWLDYSAASARSAPRT